MCTVHFKFKPIISHSAGVNLTECSPDYECMWSNFVVINKKYIIVSFLLHTCKTAGIIHIFIKQETQAGCNFIYKKLTLWNRGFLEELIVAELVKKFPSYYGTWRFITCSVEPITHNLFTPKAAKWLHTFWQHLNDWFEPVEC
jgi:hypothetical protein